MTKIKHVHLWDLPKKFFKKKTKSEEYRNDLLRITQTLQYTNTQLQHGAQICNFDIKCINQKSGYRPKITEVFNEVEKFVYHYENYCFRIFALREKLLQFLNAILPIGYEEKEIKIQHIIINPIIRQSHLLPLLEIFNKPN